MDKITVEFWVSVDAAGDYFLYHDEDEVGTNNEEFPCDVYKVCLTVPQPEITDISAVVEKPEEIITLTVAQ